MSDLHEMVLSVGGFRNLFESLRNKGVDVEKVVTEALANSNPLFSSIGFRVRRLSDGRAEIEFPMSREASRAGGIVHGGIIMYALDTTLGLAVMTASQAINQYTLELKVNFLEQLKKDPFTVEGRLLRLGRTTAVAEGEIRDAEGTICSKGIGTWYLVHNHQDEKKER
ncbi:MAG: PaaI family thioesterase [Conexivisphaerales archaeon]